MNTKQLRKKSFGWLSVFLRWHLFFIFAFFFLFYSSAWDKCQLAGLYLFCFLHNGLASKWLFWFVFCLPSIRFCFSVSLVFSPLLTIIIIIVITIVTPKFRSSYHEIHDSFGTLWTASGDFRSN